MTQLRDIRGLDAISWWPLGLGWWISFIGLISLLVIVWMIFKRVRRDWRKDARHRLGKLRKQLRKVPARIVLGDFSELMRRIAMARFGRESCAGLTAQDWLNWLEENDPKGFKWSTYAELLLKSAYAPLNTKVDIAALRKLLKAAHYWVDAEQPQANIKPVNPFRGRVLRMFDFLH